MRADVVKKLLADVRAGRVDPAGRHRTATLRARSFNAGRPSVISPARRRRRQPDHSPDSEHFAGRSREPQPRRGRYWTSAAASEPAELTAETEAVAADYRDRRGYDPTFLGEQFAVDLPSVARDADDVLDFEFDGASETELRYEHFSVVMSRSRRMCFLSACNIDGNQSRKSARVAWKWDPRIPKTQQIMKRVLRRLRPGSAAAT